LAVEVRNSLVSLFFSIWRSAVALVPLNSSRCRAWTAGMSGCVCQWLRRSH
jgi:hypothetical protein